MSEKDYCNSPQTERNPAGRFDAKEGILGGRRVEARRLGVSEEGVRPPDLVEHLVADAKLLFRLRETQATILPVLTEVEVQCKVLQVARMHRHTHTYIHIYTHMRADTRTHAWQCHRMTS